MSEDIWLKQMVSTVRQGRKITVSILDEEQQEGYLAGMDEHTLFLLAVDRQGTSFLKLLIPRSSILFVHIQDKKTFRDEFAYEEMLPIVQPFQDFVNKTYFAGSK